MRAIYVKSAVTAVPRDAARIISAPSAIPSLYLVALSQPAATTAPRARASATATAAVERADEALLYARLRLPVVVGHVKSSIRPHARDLALVIFGAPCVERTRRVDAVVKLKFNFYAASRTSVARLDLVADAHAPAAPVAAVVALPLLIATPCVLGFNILF